MAPRQDSATCTVPSARPPDLSITEVLTRSELNQHPSTSALDPQLPSSDLLSHVLASNRSRIVLGRGHDRLVNITSDFGA